VPVPRELGSDGLGLPSGAAFALGLRSSQYSQVLCSWRGSGVRGRETFAADRTFAINLTTKELQQKLAESPAPEDACYEEKRGQFVPSKRGREA